MKNRRLFWQIVEKIEALIDSGKYPPGSRLPAERELAETFNVSRPTVREAIIALEVRQRVEVKTSSGVYVLENQSEKDNKVQLSAFELTQARALVEGEAAALAAVSISDEELKALKKTLDDMQAGVQPEKADREFHLIISGATKNNAILLAVTKFWLLRDTKPEITLAYKNVCNHSNQSRIDEHAAIYEALAEHNSRKARAAMHAHFNRLINSLFTMSENAALDQVRKDSTQTRDLYSLSHLLA